MFDPSRAINGTFGYIYINGIEQSHINHCEASIELEKRELKLCGNEWTQYKITGRKGTGTMSGFKVTSSMILRDATRFSLLLKLDDPEAYGHERIRLDNVIVDKITLANWTSGEEVTEEVPFTFSGYQLLDPIMSGNVEIL